MRGVIGLSNQKFEFWIEFKKDWAKLPNLLTEFRAILCFVPMYIMLFNNVYSSWIISKTMFVVHHLTAFFDIDSAIQTAYHYLLTNQVISEVNDKYIAAMIIFIAAAVTDKLDGLIAKNFDMVTPLGKVMDPTVDKFLVVPTLIGLCPIFGRPLVFATIFIALREIYVAAFQSFFRKRNVILEVVYSGRVKMVMQCVTVSLLFIPFIGMWQLIWLFAMIIVLCKTFSSGGDYHVIFMKELAKIRNVDNKSAA